MSEQDTPDKIELFEQALADAKNRKYYLTLYITGATPKSTRAIANLKAICEEHLRGQYVLEIVDIYQQPELAQQSEILAVPTLIKLLPPPLRKLVGDMSDEEHVLAGLGLQIRT